MSDSEHWNRRVATLITRGLSATEAKNKATREAIRTRDARNAQRAESARIRRIVRNQIRNAK